MLKSCYFWKYFFMVNSWEVKFCLLLLPFLQCKTGCYRARRFTWKEICQFYNFSTLYDFVAMALIASVKYLFSESAGSRSGEVLVSKRWWLDGERALDGASHLPHTATIFTTSTVTLDLPSGQSRRLLLQWAEDVGSSRRALLPTEPALCCDGTAKLKL